MAYAIDVCRGNRNSPECALNAPREGPRGGGAALLEGARAEGSKALETAVATASVSERAAPKVSADRTQEHNSQRKS